MRHDGDDVAAACRVLKVLGSGYYEGGTGGCCPAASTRLSGEHGRRHPHRITGVLRRTAVARRVAPGHGNHGQPQARRWAAVAGRAGRDRRQHPPQAQEPAAGGTPRRPRATPVRRRRPDRLWCTHITEHPTATGKVYCCAVLDVFSRAIVGWSIADHIRSGLVVDARQMATWRRPPNPGRSFTPSRIPVHQLGLRSSTA
jgi:putative transposase